MSLTRHRSSHLRSMNRFYLLKYPILLVSVISFPIGYLFCMINLLGIAKGIGWIFVGGFTAATIVLLIEIIKERGRIGLTWIAALLWIAPFWFASKHLFDKDEFPLPDFFSLPIWFYFVTPVIASIAMLIWKDITNHNLN